MEVKIYLYIFLCNLQFHNIVSKMEWKFTKYLVKLLGATHKNNHMRLEDDSYSILLYTSICNASKVRTKIWEMRSSNIYYVNISSFREPIVESIQNLNFTLGIPTKVQIWHAVKNGFCLVFISLIKIIKEGIKIRKFLSFC